MSFNLFHNIPASAKEEFAEIATLDGTRIERIVSPPAMAPGEIYNQAHNEWVLILQGWADLRLKDQTHRLHLGDSQLIPAGTIHQVITTSPNEPTIWLAIHHQRANVPLDPIIADER